MANTEDQPLSRTEEAILDGFDLVVRTALDLAGYPGNDEEGNAILDAIRAAAIGVRFQLDEEETFEAIAKATFAGHDPETKS